MVVFFFRSSGIKIISPPECWSQMTSTGEHVAGSNNGTSNVRIYTSWTIYSALQFSLVLTCCLRLNDPRLGCSFRLIKRRKTNPNCDWCFTSQQLFGAEARCTSWQTGIVETKVSRSTFRCQFFLTSPSICFFPECVLMCREGWCTYMQWMFACTCERMCLWAGCHVVENTSPQGTILSHTCSIYPLYTTPFFSAA